jgi:aryl-alcohol dehydrogenase-like predicted oxidoreductase
MESPMKKSKLPNTDSIQKLAEFWDTPDLTDLEGELQEVTEPVFERGKALQVPLGPKEIAALERLAQSKGVSPQQLVRSWVLQRIAAKSGARTKRSA